MSREGGCPCFHQLLEGSVFTGQRPLLPTTLTSRFWHHISSFLLGHCCLPLSVTLVIALETDRKISATISLPQDFSLNHICKDFCCVRWCSQVPVTGRDVFEETVFNLLHHCTKNRNKKPTHTQHYSPKISKQHQLHWRFPTVANTIWGNQPCPLGSSQLFVHIVWCKWTLREWIDFFTIMWEVQCTTCSHMTNWKGTVKTLWESWVAPVPGNSQRLPVSHSSFVSALCQSCSDWAEAPSCSPSAMWRKALFSVTSKHLYGLSHEFMNFNWNLLGRWAVQLTGVSYSSFWAGRWVVHFTPALSASLSWLSISPKELLSLFFGSVAITTLPSPKPRYLEGKTLFLYCVFLLQIIAGQGKHSCFIKYTWKLFIYSSFIQPTINSFNNNRPFLLRVFSVKGTELSIALTLSDLTKSIKK